MSKRRVSIEEPEEFDSSDYENSRVTRKTEHRKQNKQIVNNHYYYNQQDDDDCCCGMCFWCSCEGLEGMCCYSIGNICLPIACYNYCVGRHSKNFERKFFAYLSLPTVFIAIVALVLIFYIFFVVGITTDQLLNDIKSIKSWK